MLIYTISQKTGNPGSIINDSDIEIIPVEMDTYYPDGNIELDRDHMFNSYGFHLSKYECDQFITHYHIWEAFKKSQSPYCLIMEDTVKLKAPMKENFQTLYTILNDNQIWDVFFPFERPVPESIGKTKQGYLFGTYWGPEVYFISRAGVEKLLNLKVIRQPVDEEILCGSLNDELKVFAQETEGFEFYENVNHKKHRQQAIKEAIWGANAWSPENKREVRKLLKTVSHIASQNAIDLILCDGSLLGYIRHDGIMPWDDDVDLALNKNEYAKLASLIENNTNLKTATFPWGPAKTAYCKIWDEDGQAIPGYPHKFPFIDIWFYSENDDQIIFDTGALYMQEIYLPFSDVVFEGSGFKLPHAPLNCLDITYPNWRTKIMVYPYSHRLEQSAFKILTLRISVDQNGRIIS
jgi:GR25 family glycosyltransferase involved in LPS biosynthesis